jgi:uncharacterized OB-fold protein
MTSGPAEADPWVVEQRWELTYRHTADEATGAFFHALRDEAKLVGTSCPTCERVLVPPRGYCDKDFAPTDGVVDVEPAGTIELFTIVYHRIQGLPDPPYALAYVRPDGADTALVNFVRGVELSDPAAAAELLAIGTRVDIEFADERVGRMTDFWYELAK